MQFDRFYIPSKTNRVKTLKGINPNKEIDGTNTGTSTRVLTPITPTAVTPVAAATAATADTAATAATAVTKATPVTPVTPVTAIAAVAAIAKATSVTPVTKATSVASVTPVASVKPGPTKRLGSVRRRPEDTLLRDRWTSADVNNRNSRILKETKVVKAFKEQNIGKKSEKKEAEDAGEQESKETKPVQQVRRQTVETLSKQNLREFIQELDLSNTILSDLKDHQHNQGIEEYLNNYQELNNNVQKKFDSFYESFLKQNRSAIKIGRAHV